MEFDHQDICQPFPMMLHIFVSILIVMEFGHQAMQELGPCDDYYVSILIVMEFGHQGCINFYSVIKFIVFQSLLLWNLVIRKIL